LDTVDESKYKLWFFNLETYFWSRDYEDDVSLRPKLVITYSPNPRETAIPVRVKTVKPKIINMQSVKPKLKTKNIKPGA